ncbi:MAG TPA: DUF1214 domain-containing protein [Nevskiaceae bacterium]|nr:DUF1214 domain-containing protein [Nevskiaceae bacterium]
MDARIRAMGKRLAGCILGALTMTSVSSAATAVEPGPDASPVTAEWSEYIRPFVTMGDEMLPLLPDKGDGQARHELYEYLFSQIASGYAMLFYSDPENPDWWPLFSHVFDALWANPDTIYYYSVVDSAGTYRVSGKRGAARLVDLQLGGGRFVTEGNTSGGMGVVQGNVNLDSLRRDGSGRFEVIVSPSRPAGYAGDWVKLTPETTYLLLRQVDYDWGVPQAEVGIERLDTPARGSRPTQAELQQKLRQIATWTRTWINVAYSISKRDRARSEKAGDFVLVDWLESGFGDQKYHAYGFDLQDDEAVVIESQVPKQCAYWAYQMVTDSWRAINPLKHQSSLNPRQAHLDEDGKFRAVISSTDPGVQNWLDTGGHDRALVYSRFNGCDVVPLPTARVVKKADLMKVLPPATPRVTPEQRETSLRERARLGQTRRRW